MSLKDDVDVKCPECGATVRFKLSTLRPAGSRECPTCKKTFGFGKVPELRQLLEQWKALEKLKR